MAPTPSQSSRRKKAAAAAAAAKPSPAHSQSSKSTSAAATATATTASHDELRAKLLKSTQLEGKLSDIATDPKRESEASRLRMEICEVLSDVLLADPNFAVRKDVSGRLWRSCFYVRIGELRNRTVKERGRMKRAMGKGDKKVADRHRKAVTNLESLLATFIGEAVDLYDYLVDKYQRMLVPACWLTQTQSQTQSQTQQSQSQMSQSQPSIYSQEQVGGGGGGGNNNRGKKRELYQPNSNSNSSAGGKGKKQQGGGKRKQTATLTPPDEDEDADQHEHNQQQQLRQHDVSPGVIPTLYKLLLNLGDLHRYNNKYAQAETMYSQASKLAPSKGNPYNQLAVVAQLNDGGPQGQPLTAVALYWYARSLLAGSEPFVTSKSNLARLFVINRQWLDKNDDGDDDDMMGLEGGASSASVSDVRGKKAQMERARAVKSAMSRKFLSKFVDVHWDLFRWNGGQGQGQGADGVTATVIAKKMDDLVESFSSLLAGAAFGDSLLVKLVCINAFAACCNGTSDTTAGGEGDNKGSKPAAASLASSASASASSSDKSSARVLAGAFTFALGAKLAQHLETCVNKLDQNHTPTYSTAAGGRSPVLLTKTNAVRLLSPFVVLCDLVSSFYGDGDGSNNNPMALPPSFLLTERGGDKQQQASGVDVDPVVRPYSSKAQTTFWTNVADVANLILGSKALSSVVKSAKSKNCAPVEAGEDCRLPKEYDELRGYVPFEGLFSSSPPPSAVGAGTTDEAGTSANKGSGSGSVYISPEEAVRALDLGPSSSSQADDSAKSASSNHEGDLTARITRLLAFVERHASAGGDDGDGFGRRRRCLAKERGSGRILSVLEGKDGGGSGTFSLDEMEDEEEGGVGIIDFDAEVGTGTNEEKKQATTPSRLVAEVKDAEVGSTTHKEKNQATPGGLIAEVKEHADDEGGDLLVYKPGADGSGPALLVPSSLLLGSTGSAKSGTKAAGEERNGGGGGSADAPGSTSMPSEGGHGASSAIDGFINPSALSAPESEVTMKASGQTKPPGLVGIPPIPQSILPPLLPQQQGHSMAPPGFLSTAPIAQQQPLQPLGYGPPPGTYAPIVGTPALPPPGFQAPMLAQQQYSVGAVAMPSIGGYQETPANQPLGGYYNLNTRNPFEPNPPQHGSMGQVQDQGQYGAMRGGATQTTRGGEINLGSLPGFGSLALEQDNMFDLKALGIDDILNGGESDGAQKGGAETNAAGAHGVGIGQVGPAFASPFGSEGFNGMPATRNPFAG